MVYPSFSSSFDFIRIPSVVCFQYPLTVFTSTRRVYLMRIVADARGSEICN